MPSTPDAAEERGPERTCIATGEKGPPAAMIRFVRGPSGDAVPDLAKKLPGRGAWVSARRDAVDRAVARKAFSRAFKAPTEAGAGLADAVAALLERRLLDAIGLSRRAGDAVAGFDQVVEALKAGKVELLCEAADGAADGRERIERLAKRLAGRDLVIGCFDSGALGLAIGRAHVVHLAIRRGAAADRVAAEARRLAGFRALIPEDWGRPAGGAAS